ncbi:CheY-like protein [Stereum hirsutum FP-91666 SS1]|uniref:CheY-like protein n=1 Tax=Stereum hirsutum (strain FP-91666) TaxID=721885 RepID=UPI000440A88C|nr:CheY-like protein [Stereum hirsutum FP-91666 SS1]EIM89259.1 CheY-like protein [Stereum hirsutum FP-91666 SS1]
MKENLEAVARAVKMAGDVALFVRRQGFWWCLVHSGDIDRSIIAVKTAIDDAFTEFNIVAHADNAEFQARVENARRQDHADISQTLQDIGGQNRRVERLLVGLAQQLTVQSPIEATTTIAVDVSHSNPVNIPLTINPQSTARANVRLPPRRRSGLRQAAYVPSWTVPPRVLLVEDDPLCRMLSSKILTIFGCTIHVAVDGLAAVVKMNFEKYDLVLMDIMLPKRDGISATVLIREFDNLTPIISMTSNMKPNDVMTYIRSGMNDVLPKPFTKEGLRGVLEKYLSAAQLATSSSTGTMLPDSSIRLPQSHSATTRPNVTRFKSYPTCASRTISVIG